MDEQQAEVKRLQQSDCAVWRAQSLLVRDKLDIPSGLRPWSDEHPRLKGIPLSSFRQRDLLDVALAAEMKKHPLTPKKDIIDTLWAVPSHSVQRRPWGPHLGCLLTTSELYNFRHDCVISGESHLRLMGFPSNLAPTYAFSEGNLRHLAGEAFSMPCCASVLLAVYLCPFAPWWMREF
jgi:hypothetical protein